MDAPGQTRIRVDQGVDNDAIFVSQCTHVKISQLVTSLQTSRQQDVFALLVPKLSTSCSKLVDNL